MATSAASFILGRRGVRPRKGSQQGGRAWPHEGDGCGTGRDVLDLGVLDDGVEVDPLGDPDLVPASGQ